MTSCTPIRMEKQATTSEWMSSSRCGLTRTAPRASSAEPSSPSAISAERRDRRTASAGCAAAGTAGGASRRASSAGAAGASGRRAERRRRSLDAQAAQRRLDHHLAGELHARGCRPSASIASREKPRRPQWKSPIGIAKNSRPRNDQHRVAEIAVQRGHGAGAMPPLKRLPMTRSRRRAACSTSRRGARSRSCRRRRP